MNPSKSCQKVMIVEENTERSHAQADGMGTSEAE